MATVKPHPLWAAAVSHPWRPVRVAAMATVYGFLLLRAARLYRRCDAKGGGGCGRGGFGLAAR
jgi:hypothetical protein